MQQNRYFFEAGAIQQYTEKGPERILECETSALDAKKIPQKLAIKIMHALNFFDEGYVPFDKDLIEVEKHAKQMQDNSVYGGGIILGLIESSRKLKELREKSNQNIIS